MRTPRATRVLLAGTAAAALLLPACGSDVQPAPAAAPEAPASSAAAPTPEPSSASPSTSASP